MINAKNFSGNYIHYGVREHAMAAAMNGMALYHNLIPFGGTFLIFSDYCKPAIRLSALMGLKVIYIFSLTLLAWVKMVLPINQLNSFVWIARYTEFKCL